MGAEKWEPLITETLIQNKVLAIGDGYRAKNSELGLTGFPFARVGNINEGFNFENCDFFPEKDLKKVGNKVSEENDIVFTSKGTVGRFAFVKKGTPRFVYSPQLCFWRVLDKNQIDPGFLFYWMQSKEFKEQSDSVKGQTDMADYVSLSDQRKMKISLPSLPTQRRIAAILTALDDKIELNRRMNETLEGMAQAVWGEWFGRYAGGEELPEGWRWGTISEIIIHSKESINPSKKPDKEFSHYSLPAFDNNQMPEKTLGAEILSNKFRVPKYCILVSKLNPRIPRIWAIGNIEDQSSVCSTEFQVLLPQKPSYYSFVYALFQHKEIQEAMQLRASGTSGSHQRINPGDILNIEVLIPEEKEIEKFDRLVRDFFEVQFLNNKESNTLAALRDALLPRLMRGELII